MVCDTCRYWCGQKYIVISYTRYYRPLVYHHFCFNRILNLQVRYLPLKIEILLENDNSYMLLKTLITFTSNLIEMTVSTNVSLNSCKQYICTTIFQKYVRIFKTGKWDTVVAKSYFCYFPCLLAWNATFIPQLGEFDDDAFILFFFRLKIHVFVVRIKWSKDTWFYFTIWNTQYLYHNYF